MKNKLQQIFTDEQVANIINYGEVIRGIHAQLATDGYFLDDGRTWNIFMCAIPTEVELED